MHPALLVNYTGDERPTGIATHAVDTEASAASNGETSAKLTDNDFDTRWAADGLGEWVTLDLGELTSVIAVDLAFAQGDDSTLAVFSLQGSTDGSAFSPLRSNATASVADKSWERFAVSPATIRYLRYVGHGNNVDTWNRVAEMRAIANPLADLDHDQLPDRWEQDVIGNTGLSGNDPLPGTNLTLSDAYASDALRLPEQVVITPENKFTVNFFGIPATGPGYEGLTRFYSIQTSPDLVSESWVALPGYEKVPARASEVTVQNALADYIDANEPTAFIAVKSWLE